MNVTSFFMLSYLDSNQDRQNQKLQCYHYTIRQSLCPGFPKALQIYEEFFYSAIFSDVFDAKCGF